MRFFIVFLIFALSLAVSASVPDTKNFEGDFTILRAQINDFSEISDFDTACGKVSSLENISETLSPECLRIRKYTFDRYRILVLLQSLEPLLAKLLEDIQTGQPPEKIKASAVEIKDLFEKNILPILFSTMHEFLELSPKGTEEAKSAVDKIQRTTNVLVRKFATSGSKQSK